VVESNGVKEKADVLKKPKTSAGDVAHALTRAGLSVVPVIGGPLKELFASIVAPPITKRRDEWVESIAKELKELEKGVAGFRIENLAGNENFITIVLQATTIAIRNHQKEKLEALRNAILNSALSCDIEENLQLMFLNFIDTFTPWHIKILKFFQNPTEWMQAHNIMVPAISMGGVNTVLENAFPEISERRDFYTQVIHDLDTRGLTDVSGALNVMMTASGMYSPRIKSLGNQFLEFITNPMKDL
jgi:hypothetical protein